MAENDNQVEERKKDRLEQIKETNELLFDSLEEFAKKYPHLKKRFKDVKKNNAEEPSDDLER